jgi:hypothetical protein
MLLPHLSTLDLRPVPSWCFSVRPVRWTDVDTSSPVCSVDSAGHLSVDRLRRRQTRRSRMISSRHLSRTASGLMGLRCPQALAHERSGHERLDRPNSEVQRGAVGDDDRSSLRHCGNRVCLDVYSFLSPGTPLASAASRPSLELHAVEIILAGPDRHSRRSGPIALRDALRDLPQSMIRMFLC